MRLLLMLLVCAAPLGAQNTTPGVTLAQIKSLSWLSGEWRGSGGAHPSFFEDYRMVDDSTMRMRSLEDSTFAVANDSSLITSRNGRIQKGNSVVTHIRGDTVRFEPAPGRRGNGFTWIRQSANSWTAVLDVPNGASVVYQMPRAQRR